MSDTPRTDAIGELYTNRLIYSAADELEAIYRHAEQLERELNTRPAPVSESAWLIEVGESPDLAYWNGSSFTGLDDAVRYSRRIGALKTMMHFTEYMRNLLSPRVAEHLWINSMLNPAPVSVEVVAMAICEASHPETSCSCALNPESGYVCPQMIQQANAAIAAMQGDNTAKTLGGGE